MASKAAEKRYAALKAVCEKYRPEKNGFHLIEGATADDMIADILALRAFGRTERWIDSVEGWADMIRQYPNDLEWAHVQGSIYVAYAAE